MGRMVQVVAETTEDVVIEVGPRGVDLDDRRGPSATDHTPGDVVIDLATPSPWSEPRAAVRAILGSGVLGSTA